MRKKAVETRITDLEQLTTGGLRWEFFKAYGFEPLGMSRARMIKRLGDYLRGQEAKADTTTNTDEKE